MSRWRTPSGAQRIEHGVGDRRRRAVGRQLADALQAHEVVGRGRGDGLDLQRRARRRRAAGRSPSGCRSAAGRSPRRTPPPPSARCPAPWTMPPWIWPASRRGLTTTPQSATSVRRSTRHRAGLGIDLDLADHDAGREGSRSCRRTARRPRTASRPPARTGRCGGRCRRPRSCRRDRRCRPAPSPAARRRGRGRAGSRRRRRASASCR